MSGLLSAAIYAQTPIRKNSLGLSIGYNTGYFKDVNFSPLNYKDRGLTFKLNYDKYLDKSNSWIKAYFDLTKSSLKSSVFEVYNDSDGISPDFFLSDYWSVKLKIAYLKQLPKATQRLAIHLGGQLHTNVNIVFLNGGTNAFTFLFAHSVDFASNITYDLNDKHQIQSSLSIPLITLLGRPPYAGYDKEVLDNQEAPLRLITNGKISTWNTYLAFDWETTYRYHLSTRWDAVLQYHVHYQRASQTYRLVNWKNQILAGIAYTF